MLFTVYSKGCVLIAVSDIFLNFRRGFLFAHPNGLVDRFLSFIHYGQITWHGWIGMRVELHLKALNILSCDHESCLWSLQERVTSRLFTLTRSVAMTVPPVVLITRPFLLAARVGRTQVIKDTGNPPTRKIRNSLKSATDELLLMRYVISNSFYAHFH